MTESRVLQLKRPVLLVSCPKQAMTVYGGLAGFPGELPTGARDPDLQPRGIQVAPRP